MVYSLGHVALETPDLDASLAFFRDAVGLEEVERDGGTVYLRAVDEFAHHSLSLTAAGAAGVDHVGWRVRDGDALASVAAHLESEGLDVTRVAAGEEAGQGEAIRFRTPTGHRFECFHGMATPDPPEGRRSRLRNKPYAGPGSNPVAPTRIDHVQVWDAEARDLAGWLCAHLGFRVHETYDEADGSRWGTFVSACETKIDAAVIRDDEPGAPPALNHVAYKVPDADHLFAAADAMNELGYPVDGFGQHSISRGKFCYARDPASGHTVEFSAGGYLVFDPDWEPVAWREGDLDDRQWVGRIAGGVNIPYA